MTGHVTRDWARLPATRMTSRNVGCDGMWEGWVHRMDVMVDCFSRSLCLVLPLLVTGPLGQS